MGFGKKSMGKNKKREGVDVGMFFTVVNPPRGAASFITLL